MLGRQTITEQTPVNNRPSQRDCQVEDIAEVAREVVGLKAKGQISEAALDAMFMLFYNKHDPLVMLKEKKLMTPNYTNGIRPCVTDRLPEFYCSLFLKEDNPAKGYRKLEGLKSVQAEYPNLPPNSRTKPLRLETHIKLKDVKEMYKATHYNQPQVQEQLLVCNITSDGAAESKSGARTFAVVTIRIHNCIYVTRVFNHLVGGEESKATALELLW